MEKNKDVYALMIYTKNKIFEFPSHKNLFEKWLDEGRIIEITSDEAFTLFSTICFSMVPATGKTVVTIKSVITKIPTIFFFMFIALRSVFSLIKKQNLI